MFIIVYLLSNLRRIKGALFEAYKTQDDWDYHISSPIHSDDRWTESLSESEVDACIIVFFFNIESNRCKRCIYMMLKVTHLSMCFAQFD